ncbi:nicotinate (nicotinamide) nucleotide adenylyltransferase [Aliarcobacter butzleri]|uniref:Probable nicotinate-nucleotide adenylyltransferase n=1 Tax=Aliarcobacter butzleri TaxID=28197 RepID=A0AAW6VHX3_9BACT|nr:nicotinate (nicotinamide) nucleotide adenylyltransferase [Aliarcobacter butzleri]MCG3652632.1 nicotinate (nicotinamide) nucleotide adenylyltransferase [Aliarcobacter butzleri]MCG3672801.1 nicotinate (nicotinamide) nucleotide adenylyltransferase [Aliarcobacter butzleri]MCT7611304.1 nicotinate (nicotinamide) nucleotide adenylyltransferase [Aliarcobacter butzleri]MDK2041754.1 nicotinate (nicotinamide) nucleotide adenylyltransferase [Aliarcobacter butzleri]MDK2097429.1 nicotinate (nicotinamide)
MEIAIFGGSFDPIHIAHKAIVKRALEELEIDKLIIVPTYLNPFKSSFYLEPKVRFELLKKVFEKVEKVEISDYEINQEKLSYSFNTVNYLKDLYKASKIYFILGQDNVENLDKWYKIEELKKMVEFVIATRSGYKSDKLKDFKTLNIDIDVSSTLLRTQIDTKYIPKEIKEDILNLDKGKKN